jgi:hypothetical protein
MSSSTRTPTARDTHRGDIAVGGDRHKGRRKKKRRDPTSVASLQSSSAGTASTSVATLVGSQPSVDTNFQSGLRAELAESRSLGLSSEIVRAEKDFLVLSGEVAQADDLLAHLERALEYQHELLVSTRSQLVAVDSASGGLREAKLRAEQEVVELRMLLEAQAAQHAAAQADAERLGEQVREQGEELRAAAAKIATHREAEAKAFVERRRLWEHTVEEWLQAGFTKRIDPIVYNVNKDIFVRLHELLSLEHAEREAQEQYLLHAGRVELDHLRSRLTAEVTELSAQLDALQSERFDFNAQLAASLTTYLKGELKAKGDWAAELERELSGMQVALRDMRREHDQREAARVRERDGSLEPLSLQLTSLAQKSASLVRERQALTENDPRKLLERQQELVERAQDEARRDRLAREKLAAELKAEKSAHAIVRSQLAERSGEIAERALEFGEKEYYQVTVGHLEEMQHAKEAELKAAKEEFEAALGEQEGRAAELSTEVEDLRKQRQTMALSLSQYATLEAEWGETKEAHDAALAQLKKENKVLKKKVQKLPQLEKAIAESSQSEVSKLKREAQHLQARLEMTEASLLSVTEAKAELQRHVDDLVTEKETSLWLAKEEHAETSDALGNRVRRLQATVLRGVLRHWLYRLEAACFKGWCVYTSHRRIAKQIRDVERGGGNDILSDEEGAIGAHGRAHGATQQRLAAAVNEGLQKFSNFF